MHHVISYYMSHRIFIHDILCHAHAYRIDQGDNIVGIQRRRGRGSVGDSSSHSSRRRGANLEELPECLDHRPTSFLKGKPQSILSLLVFYKILLESFMSDALGIRVDWKHLMHGTTLSRDIHL